MKRNICLLLLVGLLLSLCACKGNFNTVNLKETMQISKTGVVEKATIEQIKNENAIGSFSGKSNGFTYDWTIFGSDIKTAKQVNLKVVVEKTEDGNIQVSLAQKEKFGFTALLSVHLDELWEAQGATAYQGLKAVASVSVTGSKTTILNISTDGTLGTVIIRPDALPEEEETDTTTETQTPTRAEKDQYQTDPVPAGKPEPVEPENQDVNKTKSYTCTFAIDCMTILNNLDMLDPDKLEIVPSDGVILAKTTVTFYEGESVYDVLQRLCKEKGIHMESEWTPIYNSAYVEGIYNLYEFDCGALSGWMYKVNGWYPNYGSSRYQLKDGDVVEWRYTCDLGNDVGGGYAVGG